MADEAPIMSEMQTRWPQAGGTSTCSARVKRSDADRESMIFAFESPSLAFIGLRGYDLAPRICRLRFDILFHGDRIQVATSSATCTGQVI